MRHLLNTLFVTSEDIYLSLDGENVVASREQAGGGPLSPPHSLPVSSPSPMPAHLRR